MGTPYDPSPRWSSASSTSCSNSPKASLVMSRLVESRQIKHTMLLIRPGATLVHMALVTIRKASPLDAAAIAAVVEVIAAERVHSAIDRAWTVDEEAGYLAGQSAREAIHVAVDATQRVVGFQSLDRWSAQLGSMAH